MFSAWLDEMRKLLLRNANESHFRLRICRANDKLHEADDLHECPTTMVISLTKWATSVKNSTDSANNF